MAKNISPDEAQIKLKEGNLRFSSDKSSFPHLDRKRKNITAKESQGDHAFATILCCSDSRVPPELIFDAGLMDLFIVRVAGNIVGPNELASIEYGVSHVHTPALVVLGHSDCGAIKSALEAKPQNLEEYEDDPSEDNIERFLGQFKIVTHKARKQYQKTPEKDLVELAAKENIWQGIYNIFANSFTIRNHFRHGRIRILPAYYDLKSGKVEWLPERKVLDIFTRLGKPLMQTGKIVASLKNISGIPKHIKRFKK